MSHLAQNQSNFNPFSAFANQGEYSLLADFDRIVDAAVGKWRVTLPHTASSADAANSRLVAAIETKNNFHVLNAWTKHVFRPSAPSDVAAIGETVDWVMEVIESVGPNHLNLTTTKSASVHPEHLVAVLRSSFMWREDVPGWKHALSEASIALIASGFEAEDVLVGLE